MAWVNVSMKAITTVTGVMMAAAAFGEQVKPYQALSPLLSSAAVHSNCPEGWTPDAVRVEGDHATSLLCLRNGVTVVLWPDGTFNLAEIDSDFILQEQEVPEWR